MPGLVGCANAGCTALFSNAEYASMTFRSGVSFCADHVQVDEVESRAEAAKNECKLNTKVAIYCDIKLNKACEIEQLGAKSSTGDTYSAFMRTSVRTNTSSILRK